ncbi:MAG TPA: tetratricopeptide repeat protein [Candidatus Aminicenantes bacterium]|nr:tetratricopeptide repeat protein [Candidatus Aminicenantes bacterium]
MKKQFVSLTILFFLLMPAALMSQIRGQARMVGVILDEQTGKPVEGVTVKAYFPAADAYVTPSPVTDKDGRWKALFVRGGMWNLDFSKAGYIPQRISYRVVFEMGAKVPEIEIRMKRIEGLVVKDEVVRELEKGDGLYADKKFEEAVAVFQSLLEKNPDLFIIRMNIGNCYFALKNYEKAMENFLQVYEKQPGRGDVLIAIANTYNNWGKQDEAIEWYKKIPVSEIKDVDSAYNTGAVFSSSGNPADAVKYFRKAVEIDPEFADAYFQMGLSYVALGSNAEAVEALKKAVELAPGSENAATAQSIIDTLTKQ